jgi:hypothetical protein
MRIQQSLFALFLVIVSCFATERIYGQNLALRAKAAASESLNDELGANRAVDGDAGTRWSANVAHFDGVWFQLEWERPVTVAQVEILQFDRYLDAMDLQIWNEAEGRWQTLKHFGGEGKLPKAIDATFEPRKIGKLRLANFAGGPSFSEIAVYEQPQPPVVTLASDAKGELIGIVTDKYGASPIAGANVELSGDAKSGPWKAAAKSGADGLFFAPMPLGLTGNVKAVVSFEGVSAETVIDAASLFYSLTPQAADCPLVELNGKAWKFALDPPVGFWKPEFDDSSWSDIKVPAHWEMEGFHSAENVGGYRLEFESPAGKGRLKLRFDGVYSNAEVWVNGHRLACHEGGFTPFEIDISDAVQAGSNLLALKVAEHCAASDQLDKMSEYSDFDLAGIIRGVSLFRVPERHVAAIELATIFDENYRNASIVGKIAAVNESSSPIRGAALKLTLLDGEGKPVAEGTKKFPVELASWSRADAEINLPVKSPKKWDAEHPNLYSLRIELIDANGIAETLIQKIGFRQTEIRGTEILINGKPVKIKGACHHDQHPLAGRAVSPELQRLDLALMKEANLNALRTSHYPPQTELLDGADELGVYVEDEGPLCWVAVADDLRLTPCIMQMNAELLARDRNHPSVFMWSVCNESGFGYGFQRSAEWIRSVDPTRPRGGSWQDSMDIDIRHNPISVRLIDEVDRSGKKPLLWDESFAPFQGTFQDHGDLYLDPGIRDYYAGPMIGVYEKFAASPVVQGSQIWAWADDMFCVPNTSLETGRGWYPPHRVEEIYDVPGRGLCGDAPWGVVDGWRRRKPEFWITKKLHSPVKISEAPIPPQASGSPIRIPIQNRYDFSDLSELTIQWSAAGRKGTATVSVAPRSSGELAIDAGELKSGDVLAIEFRDTRGGRMIDSYRIPIGKPAEMPAPVPNPASGEQLKIYERGRLNGSTIFIKGENFEIGFCRNYGFLRRGVGYGMPVLLETPMLHVAKTGQVMRPLTDIGDWKLSSLDVKPDAGGARVSIQGSFPNFTGSYEYAIAPDGEITLTSEFVYRGEDFLARETGVKFSLPRKCELLEWDRRADFGVYPPDHIGRPHGSALPVALHAANYPPTWDWSADNSPLGTADFRSTKFHVNWATLRYPDSGQGVLFLSNADQNIRATLAGDRIDCFLTDWCGGVATSVEWLENYGQGAPIKNGQTLKSTVKFRFVPQVKTGAKGER